jgi:hypothetical protein
VRVRKFETIAVNNKTRKALAVAPTIQTRGAKKRTAPAPNIPNANNKTRTELATELALAPKITTLGTKKRTAPAPNIQTVYLILHCSVTGTDFSLAPNIRTLRDRLPLV